MFSMRRLSAMASRGLSITVLVLLIVVSASAYTIVMRDGRRLEIPSRFVVTTSTLTYDVHPGIQITLQMAAIDVEATEKANNEASGALLRRAQLDAQKVMNQPSNTSTARKTITNRELEATARRRVASEQAYETRIKELGLPPLAESRRKAEAASVIAQNELRERLAAENQSEEYWRGRATAFRTEMSALDAEIRYIRERLDQVPYADWGGSFTSVSSIAPFLSFGNVGRGNFPGHRGQRPSVYTAPRGVGPQLSGRVGFGGGTTRGRVFINPGQRRHGSPGIRPGFGVPGPNLPLGGYVGVIPNATVFNSSPAYDYSYERSELITRFNDLAAARAGLNARWRELEEEARLAGAPPGWLRR